MDGTKVDLELARWEDLSDVDPYDFLLLQWDEKLLETVVPEPLLPVARMMDAYIHTIHKAGYARLDDLLRRRVALAVLYTEQRPVEELYRLAIECGRKVVYAQQQDAWLAQPFATPADIKQWIKEDQVIRGVLRLQGPLHRACEAYAKPDYHECVLQVLGAFKSHQAGQQAILQAWLTSSPAHRSDQA